VYIAVAFLYPVGAGHYTIIARFVRWDLSITAQIDVLYYYDWHAEISTVSITAPTEIWKHLEPGDIMTE